MDVKALATVRKILPIDLGLINIELSDIWQIVFIIITKKKVQDCKGRKINIIISLHWKQKSGNVHHKNLIV